VSFGLRRPAALLAAFVAVIGLGAPGNAWAQRGVPEKPLIMAFTPSRDPTALQEAADAFVAAVARLSGVRVRA